MSDDAEMDEQRGAWSAAGGAVMALAGGGGIAWVIAASTKGTGLPRWPVIPFALVGFVGLYVLLAPLRGWRPWTARDGALAADGQALFGIDLLDHVAEAVRSSEPLPDSLPTDAAGLATLGYPPELAEALARYGRLVLLPGRPPHALETAAADVLRLVDTHN
jgi:hypothetical protein